MPETITTTSFSEIPDEVKKEKIVNLLGANDAACLSAASSSFRDMTAEHLHWLLEQRAVPLAKSLLERWTLDDVYGAIRTDRINLDAYPVQLSHAIAEHIWKGADSHALPNQYMYCFMSRKASYDRYWRDPMPAARARHRFGSEGWAKEVVSALQDLRCQLKQVDLSNEKVLPGKIEAKALKILKTGAPSIKKNGCKINLPQVCDDKSGLDGGCRDKGLFSSAAASVSSQGAGSSSLRFDKLTI